MPSLLGLRILGVSTECLNLQGCREFLEGYNRSLWLPLRIDRLFGKDARVGYINP